MTTGATVMELRSKSKTLPTREEAKYLLTTALQEWIADTFKQQVESSLMAIRKSLIRLLRSVPCYNRQCTP